MPRQTDTARAGLDLYVTAIGTIADTPWLHYGLWEPGERVVVPALRQAQERYVDKLLALLPPPPVRVLDVGGGTGAMSSLLIERGYSVEMITPSDVQADLARKRLGDRGKVHEVKFEDFDGKGPFDVVLFSESFQYVPMEQSLAKAMALLSPGGRIVIADVFRSEGYKGGLVPGAGHHFSAFAKEAERLGLVFVANEDVTWNAAQTMLLDQAFYRNIVAPAVAQVSGSLRDRRPFLHWLAATGYRLFVNKQERYRLSERLKADYRSPENFVAVNTYRFLALSRAAS